MRSALDTASAALRLFLFVLWTLLLLPPYLAALAADWRYRDISRFYMRVTAKYLVRMNVVVHGAPATDRPLLMVSNHVSYLDIFLLGALIPGSFVAKAEVRKWPGIGFLALVARTVFVDRRPAAAGKHRDRIAARLTEGEPLILFPEGTSSDGNRVLPFKSALFNVAESAVGAVPVTVQPIAVAYTRYGGLPMGYEQRPFYAWYGDMELAPHLWEVMRRGAFTAEVEFMEPVAADSFADRKALARHAEAATRTGFNRLLTGRRD